MVVAPRSVEAGYDRWASGRPERDRADALEVEGIAQRDVSGSNGRQASRSWAADLMRELARLARSASPGDPISRYADAFPASFPETHAPSLIGDYVEAIEEQAGAQ